MNYSKSKHAFENRHFRGGGGGTCYMLLPPQKNCAKTKCKWHRPWCGDDTSRLGWGVGMHQAMEWAKAAHHHGASGITFSSATGVNFLTQKVS